MHTRQSPVPSFPWGWLLPSVLLVVGTTIWGVMIYEELPPRVPRHIGLNGVDAWTDKSPGIVFLPLFVYAGVTVMFVLCAVSTLRMTPQDEIPKPTDRWAVAANAMQKRPANVAAAQRMAKAILATNALVGLAIMPTIAVSWRSTMTAEVPWWLLPVVAGLFVLSLLPILLVWWWERSESARAAD